MLSVDRVARYASLCVSLVLIAGLVSCGRKDVPVPPGTRRPRPVEDLALRITPKGIRLAWTIPARNMDGSPLTGIKGFRLYRAKDPGKDYCGTCPPVFEPPIWIPYEARPERGKRMIYEDRTVQAGFRYTYEVKTVKGWLNVSDPSNRVSGAWHVPPAPPRGLACIPGPGGIRLSWLPPSTWADGTALEARLTYKVYRSKEDTGRWRLVAGPLEETGALDATARRGRDYAYRVTALLSYLGTEIESVPGEVVTVSYKDTVPPARPKGLVAVVGKEGVELLWQEVPDADLAGYYVYRRDPGGFVARLNVIPLAAPRFVDRTGLAPGRYAYWVTAVDMAEPPNEGPPSLGVEVEVPR